MNGQINEVKIEDRNMRTKVKWKDDMTFCTDILKNMATLKFPNIEISKYWDIGKLEKSPNCLNNSLNVKTNKESTNGLINKLYN